MKTKFIFAALLLAATMVACNDSNSSDDDAAEFVAGDVIIGIKPEVAISEVFAAMNNKEIFIDQMSGFYYYSTFPSDSLEYIKNNLKDKSYLNKNGFTGGSAFISPENRITVTQFYFEMNKANQEDWLDTMEALKLESLENDTRNILVKVSPGTEKVWMKFFRSQPYVKWVELNEYADIEPLN